MRMKWLPLIAACAVTAGAADLFHDDFSHFPPGWLTNPVGTLNAAIQEYHYLPHRGVPLGAGASQIGHLGAGIGGDERGVPYREEQLDSTAKQWSPPLFITGDGEWSDYAVEASVKLLSLKDAAGVVFRYHTNRHYYLFSLADGKTARLERHEVLEPSLRVHGWKQLAGASFPYDTSKYYRLKVENNGPRMRAFIDGKLVLEASDSEILKGKAGVFASTPARFQDFGAGRNVRFGDLDGDGAPDMLIAQNIPRIRGDAFDQISCLTAVTLDGRVLWQQGRPDARNGLPTNDTPFQIHDIDGDGKSEVIAVRDFELQILDGRTGEVRQRAWMPLSLIHISEPTRLGMIS